MHCCAGWNISILDNKTFTLPSPPSPLSAPLLISIYDPSDAPSRFMWSSVESVQAFLRTSPAESQYLFLSYAREHLPSSGKISSAELLADPCSFCFMNAFPALSC